MILLSSHLRLYPSSILFLVDFPTKFLFLAHATCASHLALMLSLKIVLREALHDILLSSVTSYFYDTGFF